MRRSALPRTRTSSLRIALAVVAALTLASCSTAEKPVVVNRETLGTVVTVTAFGPDRGAVEAAVDAAFARMTEVEMVLNAYPAPDGGDAGAGGDSATAESAEPSTKTVTIAEFNRAPNEWQRLDPSAIVVLDRVVALKVTDYFSPALKSVMDLWDFEGEATVPSEADLDAALRNAGTFTTRDTTAGVEAHFQEPPRPRTIVGHPLARGMTIPPGLDLSGAAKGLALDEAVAALRANGDVTAALLTSGSTTVTFGDKPDKTPWRIGVEDPRDPEKTVAIVEVRGEVTVSTSGDYQQFFERDGMRYHHILDPATGMPARGLRSLTVVGAADGLDSDILSTALFVMGPELAEDYARQHELGLILVDDEGAISILDGPSDVQWRIIPGS